MKSRKRLLGVSFTWWMHTTPSVHVTLYFLIRELRCSCPDHWRVMSLHYNDDKYSTALFLHAHQQYTLYTLLTQLSCSVQKTISCLNNFSQTAVTLGLRTSWAKTKLQNLGSGHSPTSLKIDGNSAESVDSFVYHGSLQKSVDNSCPDMKRRISLAASVIVLLETDMEWQDPLAEYQDSPVPGPCDVRFLIPAETWTLLRVTKKHWRHSTWSVNAKSCTYAGLSMSQTQIYRLTPAYHLSWTSSEDVCLSVFSHTAGFTQGTPAHNALHC